MKGKITFIRPPTQNNKGEYFHLVKFEMLDGEILNPSMHLVLSYRNYKNWESVLVVENIVGGLRFIKKYPMNIDADSPVYLVNGKFVGEQ